MKATEQLVHDLKKCIYLKTDLRILGMSFLH